MAFSLTALLPRRFRRKAVVVPLVRLSGTIGAISPLRPGLTLAAVEGVLERAFSLKQAPAVAILINSPGGSPVQSHLIYQRIRALSAENKKPVIVAVEDVAASGGYFLAIAGDEIIVDESSIVGSIGVVSAGFGFQGLIEKLGIERRVHTAGTNKAMLDPFRPERAEDVERLKALQADVHSAFIALVRTRRGSKLVEDPDLFTGAFWSGTRAVALGLADRVGDLRTVLRERYGEELRLRPIAMERSFFRRRLGLAARGATGLGLAEGLVAAIEERLLWNRYGL